MKTKGSVKRKAARITSILVVLVMALQMFSVMAIAAPTVEKVKGKKNGEVEVDFYGKVSYKNLKVTVKDSNGKKYSVRITERDDDELEFKIKNYKAGKKYTYVISGVRQRGEKKYGKVRGVVTIPKTKTSSNAAAGVKIKKVEYDAEDRELDIDFMKKICWENPSIKITDGTKTYKAWITDYDDDDLEVYVQGLKMGKTYKYTIYGVCARGSAKAGTVKGSFVA